jgi:hypothetical protein
MTRLAKFIPAVITAVAICTIAVALPRPMQAANGISATPASVQTDETARTAGPLEDSEIETNF